jgi:16S rRNA (guanine966-N2)-methyltransferase
MRISAGEQRNRRLRSPKGLKTRPTSDRLRQAIFNVLGSAIAGARVLDLFAGSGSFGLDALSRGAIQATFVERDPAALAALRANVAVLDLTARVRILGEEVARALPRLGAAGERFDCVFLDPPYDAPVAGSTLEALAPGSLLSENALLIVQAFHKAELAERCGVLVRSWRRRYGDSQFLLYRRTS